MTDPDNRPNHQDEIGEVDAGVIAAIVARHCPLCSAAEILRRVREALSSRPANETPSPRAEAEGGDPS